MARVVFVPSTLAGRGDRRRSIYRRVYQKSVRANFPPPPVGGEFTLRVTTYGSLSLSTPSVVVARTAIINKTRVTHSYTSRPGF